MQSISLDRSFGRGPGASLPAYRRLIAFTTLLTLGLIMLGAYNAITGLVSLDSLVDAMKELVPSYRRQHIETNERALRIGAENAPVGAAKVNLDEVAA